MTVRGWTGCTRDASTVGLAADPSILLLDEAIRIGNHGAIMKLGALIRVDTADGYWVYFVANV